MPSYCVHGSWNWSADDSVSCGAGGFPVTIGGGAGALKRNWYAVCAGGEPIVYWVTSNIWRIGQQHLVLNKIYEEAHNAPAPKARDDSDDDVIDTDTDKGSGGKSLGAGGGRAGGPRAGGSRSGGSGSKPAGGASGGKSGGGSTPVRRPGAPKRDPNRPTASGGNRNGAGKGTGSGSGTGSGNGSGKGTATPASAGNRRKKRKR